MNKKLSIMVTGAGAPGIRGTLYALNKNFDGVKVKTVGIDMNPEAVGRFWMNAFFKVPAPEDSSYIDSVLDICQKESINVIIPQTTREIVALSRHIEDFLHGGIKVMVSSATAIEAANNKWKLLEVFKEHSLPFPAYFITKSEEEMKDRVFALGYPGKPVVVKPSVSNGMRGFRILKEKAWDVQRFLAEKPNGEETSLTELIDILRRGESWPELLVTEFLPGSEYSVDAFIGEKVQVAVPRLRKVIRSGISFDNIVEVREDLIEYTLQAGRRLGLRYAFGFQFKMDDNGVPKVLECNPRVQGTMVASVFSGVNVIWLGIRELLGIPVEQGQITIRSGAFKRFWGGVGVSEDGIDEI